MAKFYTPTKLSENMRETPEGFLLCLSVPIARTGWQDYADGETPLEAGPDGIVSIYRDAKEVFRPQTIASFLAKSMTITHPKDFVAPENWQELTVGIATNIRKASEKDENGEESLIADLLITDASAIKKVKGGLREVSCGYEAEYEQTGEGEGRQFNIVGNHIALVDEGRAGETYAINDHKGKAISMDVVKELKEKLAALGKTVDSIGAPKKAKAKDEDMEKKDDAKDSDLEKKEESKDAGAYDELVKMVNDLSEKIGSMQKSKDADKDDEKSEDEDEEKKDDKKESKDAGSVEERLDAIEAALAKLMESKDSDEEESEDDDMAGEEESEDSEEEKKEKKTGDSKVRKTGLESTKKGFKAEDSESFGTEMTAEKMNEINAAHWARK